jgi:M6 family metalloprotease-like protein
MAAASLVMGAVQGTASAAPPTVPPPPAPNLPAEVQPVDPQQWVNPDSVTWDDYKPVPGIDWNDPSREPTVKKFKVAMVLADYPDQTWSITKPIGGTKWGNPTQVAHDIPLADVPQWYHDFFAKPSELNHGLTINGFWMEGSNGRYGVELTVFGVYHLQKKTYQYFYNTYGNTNPDPVTKCPAALQCNGNFRTDMLAAWRAGTGDTSINTKFDNIFYVGAGQDQSSTWQEFGEMMFQGPEDVSDAFGPPQEWKDAVKAATGKDPINWAPTRYVPWTSWAAAANLWPSASGNNSIETEGTPLGTYAHELSHNLGIGDNYNNPYGVPLSRSYSGPWDNMATSYFNGPGGPHTRWSMPSTKGGAAGGQHAARNKEKMGLVSKDSILNVSRESLVGSGLVRARVTAREVQRPGELTSLKIPMSKDNRPACDWTTGDYQCDRGNFNNYTLEVIDKMGADTFVSDHGVMIAKTKNADSAPFVWTIDAHPEDLGIVNFYRPNGEPSMLSMGDYRQLSDALFHAGVDSGSSYEYIDEANKLHFYILDVERDAQGVLSYDLAVRTTDASPVARGAELGEATKRSVQQFQVGACTFPLKNTGDKGVAPTVPAGYAAYGDAFDSDVYRLKVASAGAGWKTWMPQEIVAVKSGESVTVPVYAIRGAGATNSVDLTLTATSESDSSKAATANCTVSMQDIAVPPVSGGPGEAYQVVTTDVAGGALGVQFSGNTVTMPSVTLNGFDQVVEGTLNSATVVDARGTGAGWSLTGQVSDFVGSNGVIVADNLGWIPSLTKLSGSLPSAPGDDNAAAGPGAAPGTGTGLANAKTLCSAAAGGGGGAFTCGANLQLGVPGSTLSGTYTGVLTLTLV